MVTNTNLSLFINLSLFVILISSQNVHKRFEYKYSFKGPYLAQKDNQVPFWTYSGSAIASEESFRITPSLRSQKGQAWSKNPTNFDWWEVELVFRVNGRGRIGADGLAFWYTAAPGVEGPVFGSSDQWNGFGLFFDSFDNDNKRNNPYIMGMANDGTLVYDHEHDGASQQMGGCLRDFRNKPFPIRAKVEYFKNVLTVKVQHLEYDYASSDPTAFPYMFTFGESLTRHGLSTYALDRSQQGVPPLNNSEDLSFLESVRRQLLSIDEYVSLDYLDEEGLLMERNKSDKEEVKAKRLEKSVARKVKKKNSLKKSKLRKKKKGRQPVQKRVLIHNGMTDNEKDYEMCFRAENIVLPATGYFGVTAATGGLADDHDVLKLLVHSLRSTEEMAQLRMNQEDEERFQKEFEQYQQKTQKARDEYIAQHPDAGRKEEELYETGEQRELRQIFQGQGQIFEFIKQLSLKLDEVIGRQERTLSLVSGGQVAVGQGAPQAPPAATGGGGYDPLTRNDLNTLLTNHREVAQSVLELKTLIADVRSKSDQLLSRAQGSVQPVGGSYDMHVTLKELNEGVNIVKRDLGVVNQRLGSGGIPVGAAVECPSASCLSTMVFVIFMIAQVFVLLGYFVYRDSKEAKAKKFY